MSNVVNTSKTVPFFQSELETTPGSIPVRGRKIGSVTCVYASPIKPTLASRLSGKYREAKELGRERAVTETTAFTMRERLVPHQVFKNIFSRSANKKYKTLHASDAARSGKRAMEFSDFEKTEQSRRALPAQLATAVEQHHSKFGKERSSELAIKLANAYVLSLPKDSRERLELAMGDFSGLQGVFALVRGALLAHEKYSEYAKLLDRTLSAVESEAQRVATLVGAEKCTTSVKKATHKIIMNGTEYNPVSLLAAGDSTAVFRYESARGDAIVVKQSLVSEELTDEQKAETKGRSVREVLNHRRAVGSDKNDRVLGFIGACVADDRVFHVMEVAPKGNMMDAVEATTALLKDGSIDETEADIVRWALAAHLSAGLAAVHANGVAHNDVNDHNMFLGEDGGKVADFGESAPFGSGINALDRVDIVGFLPPELVRAKEGRDNNVTLKRKKLDASGALQALVKNGLPAAMEHAGSMQHIQDRPTGKPLGSAVESFEALESLRASFYSRGGDGMYFFGKKTMKSLHEMVDAYQKALSKTPGSETLLAEISDFHFICSTFIRVSRLQDKGIVNEENDRLHTLASSSDVWSIGATAAKVFGLETVSGEIQLEREAILSFAGGRGPAVAADAGSLYKETSKLDVAEFVNRVMRRDPDSRPSAQQLAEELGKKGYASPEAWNLVLAVLELHKNKNDEAAKTRLEQAKKGVEQIVADLEMGRADLKTRQEAAVRERRNAVGNLDTSANVLSSVRARLDKNDLVHPTDAGESSRARRSSSKGKDAEPRIVEAGRGNLIASAGPGSQRRVRKITREPEAMERKGPGGDERELKRSKAERRNRIFSRGARMRRSDWVKQD